MNPERRDFLNLRSPPGRITVPEAAWKLGFEPDHIFILLNAGLLKPLGHPPPGAMRFFLWAEIEQKKNDAKWMAKACEIVRLTIKDKNERAAQNRALNGGAPPTNGRTPGKGQSRSHSSCPQRGGGHNGGNGSNAASGCGDVPGS